MPRRKVYNILAAICRLRQIQGYSHSDMATLMRISPDEYQLIEDGEEMITLDQLFEIADILNVEVIYLLETSLIQPTFLRLAI